MPEVRPTPQAAVEKAWRRAVGRSAADTTPFDAPGDYTLRLLRILFHLEAELGRSLPADVFSDARRPDDFCRLLSQVPAGPAPALFLFPGIGGDDPRLMLFRAGLPTVAMIRYPGWPEQDLQNFDFPALVDHVVAQVHSRAPAGPLRLAGYSLGGHVGYAAALRLRAQGREVARFAILDGSWSSVPDWAPLWSPRRLLNFIQMARGGEALPSAAHFVSKLLMKFAPGLAARLAPRRLALPLDFGFHLRRALVELFYLRSFAPWLARTVDDPPVLDVEMVLFRSDEHAVNEPDDLGWKRCCPRLRIIPVSGTHHGIFSPDRIAHLRGLFVRETGLDQDCI